eukprot:m.554605 g.554605  ORF g.554605 m.554605 type:complete len:67 (-) comp57752_c1_seq2:50-250(-)
MILPFFAVFFLLCFCCPQLYRTECASRAKTSTVQQQQGNPKALVDVVTDAFQRLVGDVIDHVCLNA